MAFETLVGHQGFVLSQYRGRTLETVQSDETNPGGVEIRKSGIEGLGLFATRDFKKGEIVLPWNPENRFLSEEEMKTLPDDVKKYVAIFRGRYLLLAAPGRYMNHSCDPNTETAADGSDFALRDIKKGEEITGNYREAAAMLDLTCDS